MNYFKYIVVVVMLCGAFGSQQYPTQVQIDEMLTKAMQHIWIEAMEAKSLSLVG